MDEVNRAKLKEEAAELRKELEEVKEALKTLKEKEEIQKNPLHNQKEKERVTVLNEKKEENKKETRNNLGSLVRTIFEEVKKRVTNPEESLRTHTIKKGDTLSALAKKYNVSVQSLEELNNVNPRKLTIGQVLKIPKSEKAEEKTKKKEVVQPKISSEEISVTMQLVFGGEGFHEDPYLCPAKVWTVGHGFTKWNGKKVSKNYPKNVTEEQSIAQFHKQLAEYTQWKKLCTTKLSPQQSAAITSFCFNLGGDVFTKGVSAKKIMKYINNKSFEEAAKLMLKFNRFNGKRSKGLASRRRTEGRWLTYFSKERAEKKYYIAQSGDSSNKIAKKTGLSMKEVKRQNGNTSIINPGQLFILSETASKPIVSEKDPNTYIVQKGDTLWKIAEKYGVTVKILQKENNLKGSTISINQKLKISTE